MTTPHTLTNEDIDQIIEGIDHFCIGPGEDEDGELTAIWQPYIDKLKALKGCLVDATARAQELETLKEQLRLCNLDQLNTEARMNEAETVLHSPEKWMRWCDHKVLERAEALEARCAVLTQEQERLKAEQGQLVEQWQQRACACANRSYNTQTWQAIGIEIRKCASELTALRAPLAKETK